MSSPEPPPPNSFPETHTLTYIYTQISGEASLPAGVSDFAAMGVLDGHVIDYYDSGTMRKVPKHPWMTRELSATYWEQGTQSRRSKQQWFKVNVDILLERMGHNRSGRRPAGRPLARQTISFSLACS